MSAVSETIVREYFECHGFLVRQQRKYIAPGKGEDEEIDFLVQNPAPVTAEEPLPLLLSTADIGRVRQAIVAVRGGHTGTFYAKTVEAAPEMFRFVDPAILRQAATALGGSETFTRILVLPALPSGHAARNQSLEFLKARGIDGVLTFPTLLIDLIRRVEINRNYLKSDVLQLIRILKTHGFLKEPQLELFKPRRATRGPSAPEA